MKKTETVKVAIRVRPMNAAEKKNNSINCVEIDKVNNTVTITKIETSVDPKTFSFDSVYDHNSTQRSVYDEVAFPMVESVFEGYNGTIFAYGQTGCGKTFTMMGDLNIPDKMGVIPNTFNHIFGIINSEGSSKKFLVRCSFIEIYQEEIRDLQNNNPKNKLDLREDPKLGVFAKDLIMTQVSGSKELEKALTSGNKNRHVGETAMNAESSRSHCIFTIYVEMMDEGNSKNKKIKAGKLNLVDLAGSERQSKTGATGTRIDEAKKINLSLTALSNVINALVDNKAHVPYRDSKLTRLLQDSLGGNTRTYMVAAISPASYNYEETVTTLRYAARANSIKNAPKVNEDPKDTELRKLHEEIRQLRLLLETRVPDPDYAPKDREPRKRERTPTPESTHSKKIEEKSASKSSKKSSKKKSVSPQISSRKESKKSVRSFSPDIGGAEENVVKNEVEQENNIKPIEKLEENEEYIFDPNDQNFLINEKKLKLKKLQEERAKENEYHLKEKEDLLKRLQLLENNVLTGGVEKINENEKKKFKEYREVQLKQREEKIKKKQIQDAKKKEEEELLTKDKQYNDVQTELIDKKKIILKLNDKIKFLGTEISDLKYENERDKEDMISSIKELNKENKLYHGMLKMILTDSEIKKIIDFSSWKDDSEEWKIYPFSLNPKDKNQALKFPVLKQHQINDFLENEFQGRELVIGDNTVSNNHIVNKGIVKKKPKEDKEGLNDTRSGFSINNIKEAKTNLKVVMNNNFNTNTNILKDIENRAFKNIKNNIRYDEQENETNIKNYTKNTVLEPINNKKVQMFKDNSTNISVINRKEQKKFEDLLKNTPRNVMNDLNNSLKKQTQNIGKIVLDPINSEMKGTKNKFFNNKKMEVSFKATFQISNEVAFHNNKIEISPKINLNNPKLVNINVNKKLTKLEKIPELKDHRDNSDNNDRNDNNDNYDIYDNYDQEF